jgi:hypothetical protein
MKFMMMKCFFISFFFFFFFMYLDAAKFLQKNFFLTPPKSKCTPTIQKTKKYVAAASASAYNNKYN